MLFKEATSVTEKHPVPALAPWIPPLPGPHPVRSFPVLTSSGTCLRLFLAQGAFPSQPVKASASYTLKRSCEKILGPLPQRVASHPSCSSLLLFPSPHAPPTCPQCALLRNTFPCWGRPKAPAVCRTEWLVLPGGGQRGRGQFLAKGAPQVSGSPRESCLGLSRSYSAHKFTPLGLLTLFKVLAFNRASAILTCLSFISVIHFLS